MADFKFKKSGLFGRFVLVFRKPFALMDAPPRSHDEPAIGLCFPVWVGTTRCTVQRAQHQGLASLSVGATV